MITWKIARWHECSTDELLNIMILRVKTFVVEQGCPYQEIDEADRTAMHIYAVDENMKKIIAYARILPATLPNSPVHIGRVVVDSTYRGQDLGKKLIVEARRYIASHIDDSITHIEIAAQTYLRKFYESAGFRISGTEFLEDGIPHLPMQAPRHMPRYQLRSLKNNYLFQPPQATIQASIHASSQSMTTG